MISVGLAKQGRPHASLRARRSTYRLGEAAFQVSVDGRPVEGPRSTVPVTAASRVVLCWRQGPALDVLTRSVVRRICLN